MARGDYEARILPSILDRLLDDDPGVSREPLPNRFQDVRQLKQSVTRDLEALLNSRQEILDDLPAEFAELSRSLIIFGLPDFLGFSLHNPNDRNRIQRTLENAIATFEPRLSRVRVSIHPPREHEQALHFRIEAVLRVDPAPEPVEFDAMLQLATQQYVVRGRD